ncbi:MAG TPA: permease prefix domain 1-containing protein, partial [Candidatus Angelobacter sp.]|nr:permease prefix domain 1-containing protein [Candidatus Angelobacter sp.]
MDSMLRFLRKLWFLLRRPRFATDLAEEMAYHRELSARDLAAEEGLTPEQARSEAARQFGNATRAGEESLETVAFRTETLWQDLRYATRQLRHNPGFAVTAIIILALGIGATTAIFSAVNPILFEPLPYPEPQRIMSLAEMRTDSATVPVAFGTFYGLRERSRSFDAISVFKAWQPAISSDAQPERLEGQSVTPDYFR